MGRSVKKDVYTYSAESWNLTSTKLFVYNRWKLIQELDGSGTVEKSYIWGLDISQALQGAGGVGGLLASTNGIDTFLYGYDSNGNIGQMINAADGSVEAHYEYDPYGNLIYPEDASADDNPFRFSTKYFHDEIDIYYYGYRFYSSELGKWLNRDPIGERGGLNLYVFVLNNPINFLDSLGYFTLSNIKTSPIVKEDSHNCIGFAATGSPYAYLALEKGDVMRDVLEHLGWKCKKKLVKKANQCICGDQEDTLVVGRYLFWHSFDKPEDWSEQTYHAIRKDYDKKVWQNTVPEDSVWEIKGETFDKDHRLKKLCCCRKQDCTEFNVRNLKSPFNTDKFYFYKKAPGTY